MSAMTCSVSSACAADRMLEWMVSFGHPVFGRRCLMLDSRDAKGESGAAR
jgi:hypothetical protein